MSGRGGPEVLSLTEVADPAIADNEVLVSVSHAGVNFADVKVRRRRGQAGDIVGIEGAGVVVAVGAYVTDIAVGDRVAWLQTWRKFTAPRLPAHEAVVLPDDISDDVAAAVMVQALTAHQLCTDTYSVREGDWVVVHAAAGGVGLHLCQIAAAMGARVVGTTSSTMKAESALAAGAETVLDYADFVEGVRRITESQGAADAARRDRWEHFLRESSSPQGGRRTRKFRYRPG